MVRYRYSDGRGRPREGFVAPFGMVLYRHGLCVIGARLEHAKADPATSPLGIFAIARFADAEHLREHEFVVPADFDIRDHMHGAFGPHLRDANGPHDIVVEFSRERAMYASSRTWLPLNASSNSATAASGSACAYLPSHPRSRGFSNGARKHERSHPTLK